MGAMANKEIRVSSAGGGSDGVSALPLRDMVFEVLTRLPAKSLMRFKCVSKFWCSIIGDPLFSKAHRSASGLLTICPERYNLYFLSAAIPPASARGEESTTPSLLISDFKLRLRVPVICDGVTQVINGLLCFYAGNRATLWNISTLEMMKLPFSNIRSFPTGNYYFGFHSSTNEYKLLKVCSTFHFSNSSSDVTCTRRCEILALGKDASWRSIEAPLHKLCTPSVCVHGALFWLHPSSNGYSISVFDLKEESFQVILQPPRTLTRYDLLLQFRGHVAVAGYYFRQSLDLWVLENYEGQSQSQSQSWTKHLIDLPFDLADKGYWFPAGNLSTGEMLLTGGVIKSCMPVYSYDHAKDKFEELVIGRFGPSPSIVGKGTDFFQMYYYEENIVPLSEFELSRAGADLQWVQPGI